MLSGLELFAYVSLGTPCRKVPAQHSALSKSLLDCYKVNNNET